MVVVVEEVATAVVEVMVVVAEMATALELIECGSHNKPSEAVEVMVVVVEEVATAVVDVMVVVA